MSDSTEPIILLVNRALPYNCVGKLTGWSGVEYGQSVFEEAHGAHVCRLPLAQWRACKDDVARGSVRRACQWEVDVELPDSPAISESILDRVRNADASHLEAIVSGLGATVQAVVARVQELAAPAPAPPPTPSTGSTLKADSSPSTSTGVQPGLHTADSLAKVVNYRKLLQLAVQAGVDNPEQWNNTADLRTAILARQSVKA